MLTNYSTLAEQEASAPVAHAHKNIIISNDGDKAPKAAKFF